MSSTKASLYWDCSFLSLYPNRNTGIERVVRELGKALDIYLSDPDSPYVFRPCISDETGHVYVISEVPKLGENVKLVSTVPASFTVGDVYITDASWDRAPLARLALHWKQGLILGAIQHDLIPISHPDSTTSDMVKSFTDWMLECAQFADFYACTSKSTLNELKRHIGHLAPWRPLSDEEAFYFTMGSNLGDNNVSAGHGHLPTQTAVEEQIFLMVGTVEPRKQHSLVLDAFEELWDKGYKAKLVVVGAPGWNTEAVQRRLNALQADGRPIIWHRSLSDEELADLYSSSTALVIASQQEGFGLPIVEALSRRLPIIASDIEVFHEVAKDYALYFSPDSYLSLTLLLEDVLKGAKSLPRVNNDYIAPTWHDAAVSFVAGLISHAKVRQRLRDVYDARVAGLATKMNLGVPDHSDGSLAVRGQEDQFKDLAYRTLKSIYANIRDRHYAGYPIRLTYAILRSSQTRRLVLEASNRVTNVSNVQDRLAKQLAVLQERVDKLVNEVEHFETRMSGLLSLEREHSQNRISHIEETLYDHILSSESEQNVADESL